MRPFFPVVEKAKEYILDDMHSVRAYRLIAYLGLNGKSLPQDSIEVAIDTGAPFSVLPYGIWAHGNLEMQLPPGRSLRTVVAGAPGPEVPEELTWLGVQCVMGHLRASLVDEGGRRSQSFTMLAKLPLAPLRPSLEKLILLGQHFFAFNRLALLAQPGRAFSVQWHDGKQRSVVGWIAAPRGGVSPSVVLDRPESFGPVGAPVASGP